MRLRAAASILALAATLLAASCARAPLKGRETAMRKVSAPDLTDDLPIPALVDAVSAQMAQLEAMGGGGEMVFGERSVTRSEYVAGLKLFIELARAAPDPEKLGEAVRESFEFHEVYGDKGWGEVFITSYFEPRIEGSLRRTERFTQPAYRAPDDLLSLDLVVFDRKFEAERKLRGRVVGKALVPYFSREEIDSGGALKGRKLELCWLDPVDAFFLQIQGSGSVDVGGGRVLRLNYAEKNGHPYEPVGKFLKSRLQPEQLNLQGIEAYLRTLPKGEMQAYLNRNPSYVFFQALEQSALTYFGLPAVDGRTIATDKRYFPKGALAFLSFEKPVFESATSPAPARFEPTGRFVLDQDIGGAITGGGRVDLFWGRGNEAKRHAGVMRGKGRLYYLVPKARVVP